MAVIRIRFAPDEIEVEITVTSSLRALKERPLKIYGFDEVCIGISGENPWTRGVFSSNLNKENRK